MNIEYEEDGYFVVRQLFRLDELSEIHKCLLEFHQLWKQDNQEFHLEKAVNSAYLTGTRYLSDESRQKLFSFIGSSRIMDVLTSIIPADPMFMNTQLFLTPITKTRKTTGTEIRNTISQSNN